MNEYMYKISCDIDYMQLDILDKALNLYGIISGVLEYPENVEECNMILHKIKRDIEIVKK